jgi:hypothetical protein
MALGQIKQNDQLSLDISFVGGGAIGRDISHTNSRVFSLLGGVVCNHEAFSGETPDQSIEAIAGGTLEFFSPGHEDFKITNSVVSYYALGRTRVRLEMQNAWRHEFWKDFYWSLNGFDSFDSDPPDGNNKNDFGVAFTLGWKF